MRLSGAILADARAVTGQHIALVADRRLGLAALRAILLREPGFRPVQESHDMDELAAIFADWRPAVVVADGNWSVWCQRLDPRSWGGRTLLVLDPVAEPASVIDGAGAGIHGFVSRTGSATALITAIDTARRDGYYIDPLVGESVFRALREAQAPNRVAELTPREREIVVRVAAGRSSKEIAREYAVTPKTVANQVALISHKLRLRHRGELVLYALQRGLVTPDSPTPSGTSIPFSTTVRVG